MKVIIIRLVFLVGCIVAGTIHFQGAETPGGNYLFRFGAVADCQYCNATSKVRKYNLSPAKLTACVEHYNKLDLAFVATCSFSSIHFNCSLPKAPFQLGGRGFKVL